MVDEKQLIPFLYEGLTNILELNDFFVIATLSAMYVIPYVM